MNSILVLRLSSMGDVLLTLPVMRGLLDCNPDLQLIFVTRKKFVPYFTDIDRLVVVSFQQDSAHKGLTGIWRLFREIRKYPFTRVVDLHGILRTRILDTLFLITGCPVYTIRKHRMLRKLILKHKRPGMSVPHTVDRYLSVFEKAGVTGTISKNVFPRSIKATRAGHGDKGVIRIGLAPISRHKTKNWGFNNIAELINLLRAKNNIEIHLFGGPEDQSILNSLSGSDVFNHAGLLNLKEELLLMQSMDLFLSMDSANMHLASLAGVPTLSIWGATDPCLGFAPLFQPDGYSLRADQAEVTCRPCSVYGEVPCKRFDAPMICMKSIKPQMVIEKINNFLQADHNSEGL